MSEHEPCEVDYETYEVIEGQAVSMGTTRLIRCGCTVHYEYEWGHHEVGSTSREL